MSRFKFNQSESNEASDHTKKTASMRLATAFTALALVTAGCVSNDDPEGGTEIPEGTETTAAAGSEGQTPAGEYQLAPLPEGLKRKEVLDLVIDIHGPTDNVSAEINRLIYFPEISTPKNAHIVTVKASPKESFDDEKTQLRSGVGFIADGAVDDLVTLYESELAGKGWKRTETSTGKDLDGYAQQERTFKLNEGNFKKEEVLELAVAENTDLSKQIVTMEYSNSNLEGKSLISRLEGWHGDIPLPDGANHDDSGVYTTFETGETTARFQARYNYAESDTEESLMQRTADLSAKNGYNFEQGKYSVDVAIESEIVEDDWEIDLTPGYVNDQGYISLDGQIKFDTPPFETGERGPITQSTEPLKDMASATDIQAVLSDMAGPTEDVSAQMQRLGEFPDLATPAGAEILAARSTLGNFVFGFGGGDEESGTRSVTILAKDDADTLADFYKAELGGKTGWTLDPEQKDSEDSGTRTISFSYNIEGSALQTPFDVRITDNPRSKTAKRQVELTYSTVHDPSDAAQSRHLGWISDIPLPDGGELDSTGISLTERGLIRYEIKHDYPNKTKEQLPGEVVAKLPSGKYTLQTESDGYEIELKHPDFAAASIIHIGTRAELIATKPVIK